jgi:hypothetical protein
MWQSVQEIRFFVINQDSFVYNFVPFILLLCEGYNKPTNAQLIDNLLYCSLFITPTCFNVNASSSGNYHLLPA